VVTSAAAFSTPARPSAVMNLLVPALAHLTGRANWWLPGWLDRILPHLSIEPAPQPPVPPSPAPVPAGAVPISDV
jgi:putative drug exporter of the RND superfamily